VDGRINLVLQLIERSSDTPSIFKIMKFFITIAAVLALVSMVLSNPVADPEPNVNTKLAPRQLSAVATILATFWVSLVANIAVLNPQAAAGVTSGMQAACASVETINASSAPVTLPASPVIIVSLSAVGTAISGIASFLSAILGGSGQAITIVAIVQDTCLAVNGGPV